MAKHIPKARAKGNAPKAKDKAPKVDARSAPKRAKGNALAPDLECPDPQRTAREEENRVVQAWLLRNPRGTLFSVAHALAGSSQPGGVEAGRILTAIALTLEWRDVKALKGKGGPLAWAKRQLEKVPQPHAFPSSRFAFAKAFLDSVNLRTDSDTDELASWALARLLVSAEGVGLGWHTHTPGDVDGLKRRIAREIRKVRERERVPEAEHIAVAILVGWGMKRDAARKVFKKVKDPVPGDP